MSEAHRRGSNTAFADLDSIRQSRRLRRIVHSGLISSFQPIYAVGQKTPFAVEGFIRGPVGNSLENPDKLFQAAHEADASLALDEAAYREVLTSFAALQWTGKLFLNLRPRSLLDSAFALRDLRAAMDNSGLHPSQIVLEFT